MSGFISSQNGLSWKDGAAVAVHGGGDADRHRQHAPGVRSRVRQRGERAVLDESEPSRGGAVLRRDGQHRAGERDPPQVRHGRAHAVLTCVDADDHPGAGVEGVPAGRPAVAMVAGAQALELGDPPLLDELVADAVHGRPREPGRIDQRRAGDLVGVPEVVEDETCTRLAQVPGRHRDTSHHLTSSADRVTLVRRLKFKTYINPGGRE